MAKKIIVALILIALFSGSVFGLNNKHESGNMLLGIDLGVGVTPSMYNVKENTIPTGNYAVAFDVGLNFDYYLFNWLSLSSGIFMHSGIYLFLDKPLDTIVTNTKFTDWVTTPVCFTLPIMAHFNIPVVDFLYLGAGLTLNFPVSSMLDSQLPGIDTKGKFYLGLPIDLGFDFIKPGRGGARFFFRITPEIHEPGTPVLVGFMWQIYNFKIK